MQTKVSMVITCYNKERYITSTLDSVLAQKWDNIELILVNDGSTDGTRGIIDDYELRFKARGYEVVIIDQENQGVAFAVHVGLLNATGGYICMPDADDVLLPDYVSCMAEWLDAHEEDKWVVCDSTRERWLTYDELERTDEPRDVGSVGDLAERYILMCNFGAVWILMIRAAYLNQAGIVDSLALLDRSVTQEPQIWLPIILEGGKGTYIPRVLHRWVRAEGSITKFADEEAARAYARGYKELIFAVLEMREISDKKLYVLAEVREVIDLFWMPKRHTKNACFQLSEILKRAGYVKRPIPIAAIRGENLREGVEITDYDKFLKESVRLWLWTGFIKSFKIKAHSASRVIGYGVLGKAAAGRLSRLLPLINKTSLYLTEMWDKAGDGVTVKKPNVHSLGERDLVIIFLKKESALDEIRYELKNTRAAVLDADDIVNLIDSLYDRLPEWHLVVSAFPRIYEDENNAAVGNR